MSEFDPQNFYDATTPPPPPHAALKGETRADVCIVGGGISGLSAALHLAERGFSVALLEAQHLGFGGSGAAAGKPSSATPAARKNSRSWWERPTPG